MKQRTYTQRRHRTQRTQRARHTRHLRQRGGEKQKIIVLSNSNIKKDAMRDIFKPDRYELIPIEIKDNPARAPQPLFIDGTKQACAHRIKDYYTGINEETKVPHFRSDLPPDTPVVSIENGILSIDGENQDLIEANQDAISRRDQQKFTIPSTMEKELKINPFLRVLEPQIRGNYPSINQDDPIALLAAVREAKNHFQ
jgi:hypothetical protein